MKIFEIGRHTDQIHKIREMLGDHNSSVGRIKRKGMRPYLFARRIKKLRHHEKELKKMLEIELKMALTTEDEQNGT